MEDNDRQVERPQVPWTVRDMVYAGIATVALMLVGAVVLSIGLVVLALVLQFANTNGLQPLGFDPENLGAVAIIMFGLEALMVLPVWWWSVRKYRVKWTTLGLKGFSWMRGIAYIFLGFVAILAINAGWGVVMERFDLPGQPSLVPIFGDELGGLISALIVAAIVAPVVEELFFRGFVFQGLRDRWGLAAGVILSSVLFGVVHLTPSVLLPIIAMGAIFALLYEVTDSVWPPIILHGLMNALAVLGHYAAEALESLPF